MEIRTYHDFVIFTDDVRTDKYGNVKSFSVRVFDSPVGQGEKKETVRVPQKVLDGQYGFAQAIRKLEQGDFDARVEKQIQLGQLLAGLLLPEYARELFERSLAWLRDDEGIRLRLRLADELVASPWEYMHVQDTRGEPTASSFLALNPRVSIVRHEALARPAEWEWSGPANKRHIVIAMATPEPHADYPKLEHLPGEQKQIREALNKVEGIAVTYLPEYQGNEADSIPGARLQDVVEALTERTDIFHFGGHGEFVKGPGPGGESLVGEGSIILASDNNRAVPVPADYLLEVLRSKGIRLAVLGACETGQRDNFHVWSSVAPSLLKGGIPAVVAMQFSIRDDLAAAFMGAFYQVLAAGRTIDEAVARGRAAIRMKTVGENGDIRDWGVPVLYLRATDGRIFNPLSDEGVRTAVEKELTRLVDLHITEGVAPSGVVVGEVTKDVEAGEVEVITRVDKGLEGLVIGNYAIDIKGGQITVRMKADRVTGVVIGSVMTGAKGWARLDELLEGNFKAVKPPSAPPGESGAEEPTGLKCPECGRPVEEDWTVCPFCQAELRPEPTCPNCGKTVESSWAACPYCRTSLQ